MARLFLISSATAAFMLAGCATSGDDGLVDNFYGAELTPVLAWSDDGDRVSIRVPSNGCTTKDSFHTQVSGSASAAWTFELALIRTHEDHCRAMIPTGVELSWTKDELGLPDGAGLRVVNPRNHDFY